MAKGKLAQSGANVQGLLNDSEAMRELVQGMVQSVINAEFEKHMGRKPYERDKGRATHRNGLKTGC